MTEDAVKTDLYNHISNRNSLNPENLHNNLAGTNPRYLIQTAITDLSNSPKLRGKNLEPSLLQDSMVFSHHDENGIGY